VYIVLEELAMYIAMEKEISTDPETHVSHTRNMLSSWPTRAS